MEDQQIIELFFCRDRDAVKALSDKYGAYCQAIIGNILESPQDVEECLNDVYLRIWNAIPPAQPDNLAAYVGRTARNLAFNRYRDDRTQKRGGNVTLLLGELAQIVSGNRTPEQVLDEKALTEAINAFLGGLPQWKRYIFIHRFWYAEPVNQIAQDCGRSEGYVSMTLTRLRRKLHHHLKERGFDL